MDVESGVKEVMLQMHEKYAGDYEALRQQITKLKVQNIDRGT